MTLLAVLLAVAGLAVAAAGWVADRLDPRPHGWLVAILDWADRRSARCRRQALASWLLAIAAGLALPPWGLALALALGLAGVAHAWEGRRTWANVRRDPS